MAIAHLVFLSAVSIITFCKIFRSLRVPQLSTEVCGKWAKFSSSFSWIFEAIRGPTCNLVQSENIADYLTFQLHLLRLTLLLAVFSVCAAIANWLAHSNEISDWFERTTFSNLQPDTLMEWLQGLVVILATLSPLRFIPRTLQCSGEKTIIEAINVRIPELQTEISSPKHAVECSTNSLRLWIRWITINSGLLVFLLISGISCLCGSILPVIVQKWSLSLLAETLGFEQLSPYITQCLPAVYVDVVQKIIEFCIIQSVYCDTKTTGKTNWELMLKLFAFSFFTKTVVPTFGLSSLKPLELAYEKPGWNRLFLPDNGAFFVNYLISAALIGNSSELLAVPQLAVFACRRLKWKYFNTERCPFKFERISWYYYEEGMAHMLSTFATIVMYSISCPVVTVVGVLYFVLKIFVTRFQLAETTSEGNSVLSFRPYSLKQAFRIATLIITFIYSTLPLTMFAFSWLRYGFQCAITVITLSVFFVHLITSAINIVPIVFPSFKFPRMFPESRNKITSHQELYEDYEKKVRLINFARIKEIN